MFPLVFILLSVFWDRNFCFRFYTSHRPGTQGAYRLLLASFCPEATLFADRHLVLLVFGLCPESSAVVSTNTTGQCFPPGELDPSGGRGGFRIILDRPPTLLAPAHF